ncbi:hypothetical protein ACJBU6_06382 [Exserohilum turcicum]
MPTEPAVLCHTPPQSQCLPTPGTPLTRCSRPSAALLTPLIAPRTSLVAPTLQAVFGTSKRPPPSPMSRYIPYPGAEPIPDCVWECCGCRRRWLTKEMGNICIGCSHTYSVDCCRLVG